ncbi:MAG: NYN domain-containing protein [Gemmatimonadetes bacterium]|uniref:NYN domain-containing protein n=1 Tax=Candidatus Kutchimonas denitrificans TaxID=3056748 RepID=A0AAE5CC87_9BACT|nr:NYN domain-containing protein [Gemmatimonadota bacterium]NIR75468.1 NYN domain-containing protein [Candidatus Kutchimonas denitrificans]NIS01782.1 NYN domain-containing protein [Gemmatimonadota bacterium]NIT67563.1 NYN domain-containing protein [Gemmatimonadota bacterium]NIU53437.1 NYN domain-containing protein [Gemmatimonadota bacterium]
MSRTHDSPDGRGEALAPVTDEAHQAALLIDFDNVTMGIRSNLGQEMRNLLNSEVIRGKVAVQRAYADWRRYPQYIVPLSEASIDLIFAPAYGSSKKNATDIRLAIDALELVFIRPEIRTYILMSGDSDFSSLVLKLKEYGKYVIGVGIQESSSDLLVQNCDEYYSYTALSGLSKTSDQVIESHDPWVLVEKAVSKMVERGDTMRSDRLKQVMLEIDPSFDEKEHGFSKFNRFVVQAASKGLVSIQKMENGQYGVAPGDRGGKGRKPKEKGEAEADRKSEAKARSGKREDRGERGRAKKKDREGSEPGRQERTRRARPKLTMEGALALLDRTLGILLEGGGDSVRDSDVKRRMLELEPGFDEGELGYSKFSKFLQAAEEQGAIRLTRGPNGNYHVSRGGKREPKAKEVAAEPEAGVSTGESTMRRLARFFFGGKPEGAEEPSGAGGGELAPTPGGRPTEESRRRHRGRGPRREARGAPRADRREGPAGRGRRDAEERSGRGREVRREERRAVRDKSEARQGERRREEGRKAQPHGRREPRKGRQKPDREPEPRQEEPRPAAAAAAPREAEPADANDRQAAAPSKEGKPAAEGKEEKPAAESTERKPAVTEAPLPGAPRGTIRGRWGSRGRYRPSEAPPPIFEGQTRDGVSKSESTERRGETAEALAGSEPTGVAGPSQDEGIVAHLTGYAGVGGKTAEALVEAFGDETFRVLDEEPDRVRQVLPDHRAERVLEARRQERESEGT